MLQEDEPTWPTWWRLARRCARCGRLVWRPGDRTDYLVGLGEALYLQDSFGPAVEMFRTALDQADVLGPQAGERLFDWWATSLDRKAQSGWPRRPGRGLPGDSRPGADLN